MLQRTGISEGELEDEEEAEGNKLQLGKEGFSKNRVASESAFQKSSFK